MTGGPTHDKDSGPGSNQDGGIEESEPGELSPRAGPITMRGKIAVPIALYLLAVSCITYQSQMLMANTMANTAGSINRLAATVSGMFTHDVMIYETYLTSRDIDEERYDWRELANILRSSPGVSKVSLGGEIRMHYNPGPIPTFDDIYILLHDVNRPRNERGPGISINEGGTIQKTDEVVVNRRLLRKNGKKIGDEISLMGLRLRIVGVSDIDMDPLIPVVLVDWSHIDEIINHASETAESFGLSQLEDQDWFYSSSNLVVYAKGFWNVDKAVEAIVDVQEIIWGECS